MELADLLGRGAGGLSDLYGAATRQVRRIPRGFLGMRGPGEGEQEGLMEAGLGYATPKDALISPQGAVDAFHTGGRFGLGIARGITRGMPIDSEREGREHQAFLSSLGRQYPGSSIGQLPASNARHAGIPDGAPLHSFNEQNQINPSVVDLNTRDQEAADRDPVGARNRLEGAAPLPPRPPADDPDMSAKIRAEVSLRERNARSLGGISQGRIGQTGDTTVGRTLGEREFARGPVRTYEHDEYPTIRTGSRAEGFGSGGTLNVVGTKDVAFLPQSVKDERREEQINRMMEQQLTRGQMTQQEGESYPRSVEDRVKLAYAEAQGQSRPSSLSERLRMVPYLAEELGIEKGSQEYNELLTNAFYGRRQQQDLASILAGGG